MTKQYLVIIVLFLLPLAEALSATEKRDANGQLSERVFTDSQGRILHVPYQNNQPGMSIFYDPETKKTLSVTPAVALRVAQEEEGLLLLRTAAERQPSFLTAREQNGQLVSGEVSYTITDNSLRTSQQQGNAVWITTLQTTGQEKVTLNGYPVDPELANVLQEQYDITGYDGKRAQAEEKTIVIDGKTARILVGERDRERISVTNLGVKKTVMSQSQRGTPTQAYEEFTDKKGNTYSLETTFSQGKPAFSMQYDASGYPVGRIVYDAAGNPIPEKSSVIEYVTKQGIVCDPTRDYLCPYQKVDMRIRVGNKIVTDACRDKNCMTTAECKSDPTCAVAYGETIRAFQRANLGIALNNAYLAARSAAFFNVKNFEFIDKLFSSSFGQLITGEPSFGYCGKFTKQSGSQEGVLIDDTVLKTLQAYVGGQRTTLVLPNGTKEYLFKLNYYVDAAAEEITFNVDLYRGDAVITSLFTQDAKVPKGQRTSARGKESIIQYSKNFYDKICLRSNRGITCNRIREITEGVG